MKVGTDSGRLTIVNTKPWTPAQKNEDGRYEYPLSTIQRGTKFLAIAITREGCSKGADLSLGNVPKAWMYEDKTTGGECFMFARFNYSAGVISCKDCRIVSDGVVEASSKAPFTAEEDSLTETAIAMMPEVLFYMKIANISSTPVWNNLDNYSRGMLTVAYQASWNSLANYWSRGEDITAPTTTLRRPVAVLVASVSKWRVWTWLVVNALLTVSGVLVAVLQSSSLAKTVRDPVVLALMVDNSHVLARDTSGLCNAQRIDKMDEKLRLKLVVPESEGTIYRHAYLDVEHDEYDEVGQEDPPT